MLDHVQVDFGEKSSMISAIKLQRDHVLLLYNAA